MKHWFAIQSKIRQEQNTDIALMSRGYETYLPLTLIDKRQRRYSRKITEPLFPTYLFIRMDEGQDDFHPVTKTPGVIRIVKLSRGRDGYMCPTPVPDSLINALKAMEDELGIHSHHQADYAKGDQVRIIAGKFKDFPAKIARAKDGDERVIVLVEMFNQLSEMEISKRDIEPAA